MVENVGALRLGLVCPRGVVGSPDPGRSPGREQTRLLALPLWVVPARVHPCPRQLCPVSSPSRLVVCTPALFVLSCLPAFSQRDTSGSSQPRRPWKRLPFSTSEQHPVVRMERISFIRPFTGRGTRGLFPPSAVVTAAAVRRSVPAPAHTAEASGPWGGSAFTVLRDQRPVFLSSCRVSRSRQRRPRAAVAPRPGRHALPPFRVSPSRQVRRRPPSWL